MENSLLKEDVALTKLSKRERKYWKLIRTNSGVVELVGRPGGSKTSTLRSIAKKLNLFYVDLRITTLDETDLGCYPLLKEMGGFNVVSYAIPDWAWESNNAKNIFNSLEEKNYDGALVVFEELNRANITLRNASLKILLEKEIGTKFKFNDNVYMVATGNLGVEDDTDVEEFDSALKTRLIHVVHDLPMSEWMEEFANEHIHKDILYFLKHNPSFYYPDLKKDESTTITNPRTWTFLSDYIVKNFGKDSNFSDYELDLNDIGNSFVSSTTLIEFLRFTKEKNLISYKDVLNNKNKILELENFKKLDRDIVSRLLLEIKEENILNFNKKEVNNLITFLRYAEQEQIVTFLFDIIADDKYENDVFESGKKNNLVSILDAFPEEKDVLNKKINS